MHLGKILIPVLIGVPAAVANPALPVNQRCPLGSAYFGLSTVENEICTYNRPIASYKPGQVHPVIKEFQHLIESSPRLLKSFIQVFKEVAVQATQAKLSYPFPPPYGYKEMLSGLNYVIFSAPAWSSKPNPDPYGFVGPITTVFRGFASVPGGWEILRDPSVSKVLNKVVDAWSDMLESPDSAVVLDRSPSGWFGAAAIHALTREGNAGHGDLKFDELYESDLELPNGGFLSWNQFFTRNFREGVRPVAGQDDDNVITFPTESRPYNVKAGVEPDDMFWIKGKRMSLEDILGSEQAAIKFFQGTVHQAFLSSTSYHRWHAPVSGTVIDVSRLYDENGYLPARVVIDIQADNVGLGLITLVAIGMVEASTVQVSVKPGQTVKKGEQMGQFYFGGSTHCLIFQKGVKIDFGDVEMNPEYNSPVRGQLGVLKS